MNLLQETRDDLTSNGKTEADVRWVGSIDGRFAGSWEDFEKMADVDYNEGYGAAEVVVDLVVVGVDWWLERHDDDGAEWWEFKTVPTRQTNARVPKRLVFGMWKSMEDANAVGASDA